MNLLFKQHALFERRKLNLDVSNLVDGSEYPRIFMMRYA